MSSIVNNPHPRTLAEIEVQPIDTYTGYASCGCHQRGGEDRWWLCPYHQGVDEGWDQQQELITDLRIRIDKEINQLGYVHNPVARVPKIEGQIEGLKLVKEWLRSYE